MRPGIPHEEKGQKALPGKGAFSSMKKASLTMTKEAVPTVE